MKPIFHFLLILLAGTLPLAAEIGKVAPGKAYETRDYSPSKQWSEKAYTSDRVYTPSSRSTSASTGQVWAPRSDGRSLSMTTKPTTFNSRVYNPPEEEAPREKSFPAGKIATQKNYQPDTTSAKAVSISRNPTDANVGTPYDKNITEVKTKIYEARGKSITEDNPMLRPMQDIRTHAESERTTTAVEGKSK